MAFPGPHHPPQMPKPPKLPVPLTTDYFDQRLRPIFILCVATLALTLTVSVGYVFISWRRSHNQYRRTSTTRGQWPSPSGDGAPSRSGDEADIESYPYTINSADSPPTSTLNAGNNPYSTEQWQWVSASRTPEMAAPATEVPAQSSSSPPRPKLSARLFDRFPITRLDLQNHDSPSHNRQSCPSCLAKSPTLSNSLRFPGARTPPPPALSATARPSRSSSRSDATASSTLWS